MIHFKQSGNFIRTTTFLSNVKYCPNDAILSKYGELGVEALSESTPKDTGLTANSWSYQISKTKNSTSIEFLNSNINKGVPIAIILQYGHGTRNGGYVSGIDYINPSMEPIFQELANKAWKEVTKL